MAPQNAPFWTDREVWRGFKTLLRFLSISTLLHNAQAAVEAPTSLPPRTNGTAHPSSALLASLSSPVAVCCVHAAASLVQRRLCHFLNLHAMSRRPLPRRHRTDSHARRTPHSAATPPLFCDRLMALSAAADTCAELRMRMRRAEPKLITSHWCSTANLCAVSHGSIAFCHQRSV